MVIKAKENHVTLLCLPSHTTHKLQPLDRTFRGPLKTYNSEKVRHPLRTGDMDTYNIADKFANAYLKVQTGAIAVIGFKCTEIYPLNQSVFTEDEFVAAEHEADESDHHDDDGDNGMQTSGLNSGNMSRNNDGKKTAEESGRPSVSTGYVTSQHISPVPTAKKKKTSNRNRKGLTATVLTSSSYKQVLKSSGENKTCRPTSNPKKKVVTKNKESSGEPGTSKESSKSTVERKSVENAKQTLLFKKARNGDQESSSGETEIASMLSSIGYFALQLAHCTDSTRKH